MSNYVSDGIVAQICLSPEQCLSFSNILDTHIA
jgi:hypothetical protein